MCLNTGHAHAISGAISATITQRLTGFRNQQNICQHGRQRKRQHVHSQVERPRSGPRPFAIGPDYIQPISLSLPLSLSLESRAVDSSSGVLEMPVTTPSPPSNPAPLSSVHSPAPVSQDTPHHQLAPPPLALKGPPLPFLRFPKVGCLGSTVPLGLALAPPAVLSVLLFYQHQPGLIQSQWSQPRALIG